MPIGSFCLVLHAHLPYVLRHGRSPHGVDWLYEIAAETYLPLLELIDECAFLGARIPFALGLTPVLLEQLAHADFVEGFPGYLEERRARAERDLAEAERAGDEPTGTLARWWMAWYAGRAQQFERLERDLPRAFARRAAGGALELLSSAATHAYLPLLHEDAALRAQLAAGLHSTQRLLGLRPTGLWLPECAYRPRGPWTPPAGGAGARERCGLERFLAQAGLTHVFLDHHLVERGTPALALREGLWGAVDPEQAERHPEQGWRSVHELHGIHEPGEATPRVFAFARDPRVGEQVWSGVVGYPAHGAYREFHKHRGPGRGLRYWRVTSRTTDLGDKEPYRPADVAGPLFEQSRHFVELVARRLQEHHQRTGRPGVVTAAFDAELFGHWWFEGPRFLRDVLLTLAADPRIELVTPAALLERRPPDKALAVPEGSWGEGGDHRVWTDPRVLWMWDIEARCEKRLLELLRTLPWRREARQADLLRKAARELLLLQASDWPFAVTRGQAVDYGIKRFVLHVARFDSLVDLCARLATDPGPATLDAFERHAVADADLHDDVFADVDLEWWSGA